jgi:hypothetical protein
MLKGKQKKLDVNKDGKISGKDFAVLKAEKAKGRGMGLQDEQLPPGKMVKAESGKMVSKDDTTEYVKRRKQLAGIGTIFKKMDGGMMEENQSSGSMGGLGSIASPAEPSDEMDEYFTKETRVGKNQYKVERVKKSDDEKGYSNKKFARKLGGKMGGGMIDPTMANYKKGGSVIAKVKLGRTRPTKLY